MWILTQNGKRILNVERVEEMFIALPINGRLDFAVMLKRRADGKPFALGFYRSKITATKVLNNILKSKEKLESTYKMPIDEEQDGVMGLAENQEKKSW